MALFWKAASFRVENAVVRTFDPNGNLSDVNHSETLLPSSGANLPEKMSDLICPPFFYNYFFSAISTVYTGFGISLSFSQDYPIYFSGGLYYVNLSISFTSGFSVNYQSDGTDSISQVGSVSLILPESTYQLPLYSQLAISSNPSVSIASERSPS